MKDWIVESLKKNKKTKKTYLVNKYSIRTSALVNYLLNNPYKNIPTKYMLMGTKRHQIIDNIINRYPIKWIKCLEKNNVIAFNSVNNNWKLELPFKINLNEEWQLTGTLDMLLNNNVIIEFKSSASSFDYSVYQTHLYQMLFEKCNPNLKIKSKWLVILKHAISNDWMKFDYNKLIFIQLPDLLNLNQAKIIKILNQYKNEKLH